MQTNTSPLVLFFCLNMSSRCPAASLLNSVLMDTGCVFTVLMRLCVFIPRGSPLNGLGLLGYYIQKSKAQTQCWEPESFPQAQTTHCCSTETVVTQLARTPSYNMYVFKRMTLTQRFVCVFLSSGELPEVPRAVEGACRKDLWAGAGEGWDPAPGGFVSACLEKKPNSAIIFNNSAWSMQRCNAPLRLSSSSELTSYRPLLRPFQILDIVTPPF